MSESRAKQSILAILGHPDSESFCGALAAAYIQGAKHDGAEVRELRIGDLSFDPVLWKGHYQIQPLEPDLAEAQERIEWARPQPDETDHSRVLWYKGSKNKPVRTNRRVISTKKGKMDRAGQGVGSCAMRCVQPGKRRCERPLV